MIMQNNYLCGCFTKFIGMKAKEKSKLHKRQLLPVSKSPGIFRFWPYLLLIVAGFVLYGNTLNHGYNIDDEYVVEQNPVLEKGLKGIGEIFTSRYVRTSGNLGELSFDYRPMVKLSFGVEYLLFGKDPKTSHLVNLILYILTAFSLYRLLRLLLKDWHYSLPLLATLLFMVHPTHTEVVASLKNRDELLSFLGVLIAWIYVIRYGRTSNTRYIIYALIAYLLAYLSKSTAVVFLAVYPLSLYFFTEMRGKKLLWISIIIGLAAVVAQFGPHLYLSAPIRDMDFVENPLFFETSFFKRIATAAVIMLFYFRMLFVPYPMLYYYGYDTITVVGFDNIWVWVSIIIHVGLLVIAVRGFKTRSLWSFIILFYFITLSLYSNVVSPVPGIVAIRFMYAASLAYSLAIVYGLYRIFKVDYRSQKISLSKIAGPLAVVLVFAIPYSIHTHMRNKAWKNIESLYHTDVPRLPRSAKVNAQYAGFIMNRLYTTPNFTLDDPALNYRTNQMIGHFKKAIDIHPDYFIALNNLGTVYMRFKQNYDSAAYFLNRATEAFPDNETAFINLGSMYRDQGKYQSALEMFEAVLEINPKRLRAMAEIAFLNNMLGNHEKAQQINDELLQIDPDSELPYLYRGNYYRNQGNMELAVHFWQLAVERRVHVPTCIRLAEYYADRRDFDKANYYYGLAKSGRIEQ